VRWPKGLDLSLSQKSKEQASRDELSDEADLAPAWHTSALVALIVAVFVLGSLLAPGPAPSPGPQSRTVGAYLPLLSVEWGLAAYVVRVGRRRSALRGLLGKGWHSAGRASLDLALAAAVFCLVQLGEFLAQHGSGATGNAARNALLPSSPAESALWLLVAVSAGFCEELVYRGYLLIQLSHFSGSLLLGCLAQAVLFGLAHAEQGPGVALRFALYALLLGALAIRRRSLIAGMLAHIALDVAAPFLR
jgi:membrane protease YdiL (CAAX protease family)